MRLWRPELLPELPGRLLCALHRDMCLLRGRPWGTARGTSTWYWNLPWGCIAWYHGQVMREMASRGWRPDPGWHDTLYRGRKRAPARDDLVEIEDMSPGGWRRMFTGACPETVEGQSAMLEAWRGSHGE